MNKVLTTIFTAGCICSLAAAQTISIKGNIKDADGLPIENVLIRLEQFNYATISSADGSFTINNNTPVIHYKKNTELFHPRITGNTLQFLLSESQLVRFDVYNLQGRLCFTRDCGILNKGSYQINLMGLLGKNMVKGSYIIRAFTGTQYISHKITNFRNRHVTFQIQGFSGVSLAKTATTAVGNLIIEKLGYVGKNIALDNFQINLGDIVLSKAEIPEVSLNTIEDSLFELLLDRVRMLDSIDGPSEIKTIDFISLRTSFEAMLSIDSTRVKSNYGCVLATLLSLNSNIKIWNIADSLDAYFGSVKDYNHSSENIEGNIAQSGLMKRAMQKGGVLALSKAMLTHTPEIMVAQTQKPSFPRFLTLNYLQNTIETDILPVLKKVITIIERLERNNESTLEIELDGDIYEIDNGEIFMMDASLRLLRSLMTFFCIYDFDLYASKENKNYSWIDSIIAENDNGRYIKVISGDTLFNIWTKDNHKEPLHFVKALKYNLEERESFLTIRREFHTAVYNDLKTVPLKIKEALTFIRSETDNQENDLIKLSIIDSADGDMLDFSDKINKEGFSAGFSEKFSTLEKLMDFITEVLSGPYQFNETIDERNVALTINLSAFFTNPVTDLRQLLPRYSWINQPDWKVLDVSTHVDKNDLSFEIVPKENDFDTLYIVDIHSNEEIIIPESDIDSIVETEWSARYYVKNPIRYLAYVDSSYTLDPIRLTDDNGTVISPEEMDNMIENGTFFPYFKDYTFNGVFPEMTREKWLNQIWQK